MLKHNDASWRHVTGPERLCACRRCHSLECHGRPSASDVSHAAVVVAVTQAVINNSPTAGVTDARGGQQTADGQMSHSCLPLLGEPECQEELQEKDDWVLCRVDLNPEGQVSARGFPRRRSIANLGSEGLGHCLGANMVKNDENEAVFMHLLGMFLSTDSFLSYFTLLGFSLGSSLCKCRCRPACAVVCL